jgi:hypothetical protein
MICLSAPYPFLSWHDHLSRCKLSSQSMMAKPIAAITVCPVISILQPMVKDSINYMLEKWTINYIPMYLYIVKQTPNYRSEKQTTNFCSLKKQTLKTFVVFKKRTLETFLVNGLWIVVFCIQSISKLCSLCSTFCSLL